jgi:hypothetical protein
MKYVKTTGLVGVMAVVMIAGGAGSAAAEATLCKVTEDPCQTENRYGTETVIQAQSQKIFFATEYFGWECRGSQLEAVIKTATTPSGAIKSLTWSSCYYPTETITTGPLSLHKDAEHNATVELSGTVIRSKNYWGTCYYDLSALGEGLTFTGGNPASIKLSANVKTLTAAPHSSSLFCPPEELWTAEYKVTQPSPAYLASGI